MAAARVSSFSAARLPKSVRPSSRSANSASCRTASTPSTAASASGSATSRSSPAPTGSAAASSITSAPTRSTRGRSSRRRRATTSSTKAASRWAGRSCCRGTTAATGRSSSAAWPVLLAQRCRRRAHHRADRGVPARRLQRARRCAGAADPDLRSGDDAAGRPRRLRPRSVSRQHHSRRSHQPGGAADCAATCRRPISPGNVNNFRDRKAPTWPYFDTYTPLAKVDHNINDGAAAVGDVHAPDPPPHPLGQPRHRASARSRSGARSRPTRSTGSPTSSPTAGRSRVNHDHVLSSQMINHVTVSIDGYRNGGRNKTAGQGWANQLGDSRHPGRRRVVPGDQLSGRHRGAGELRPRLRRGLARPSVWRSTRA